MRAWHAVCRAWQAVCLAWIVTRESHDLELLCVAVGRAVLLCVFECVVFGATAGWVHLTNSVRYAMLIHHRPTCLVPAAFLMAEIVSVTRRVRRKEPSLARLCDACVALLVLQILHFACAAAWHLATHRHEARAVVVFQALLVVVDSM